MKQQYFLCALIAALIHFSICQPISLADFDLEAFNVQFSQEGLSFYMSAIDLSTGALFGPTEVYQDYDPNYLKTIPSDEIRLYRADIEVVYFRLPVYNFPVLLKLSEQTPTERLWNLFRHLAKTDVALKKDIENIIGQLALQKEAFEKENKAQGDSINQLTQQLEALTATVNALNSSSMAQIKDLELKSQRANQEIATLREQAQALDLQISDWPMTNLPGISVQNVSPTPNIIFTLPIDVSTKGVLFCEFTSHAIPLQRVPFGIHMGLNRVDEENHPLTFIHESVPYFAPANLAAFFPVNPGRNVVNIWLSSTGTGRMEVHFPVGHCNLLQGARIK